MERILVFSKKEHFFLRTGDLLLLAYSADTIQVQLKTP